MVQEFDDHEQWLSGRTVPTKWLNVPTKWLCSPKMVGSHEVDMSHVGSHQDTDPYHFWLFQPFSLIEDKDEIALAGQVVAWWLSLLKFCTLSITYSENI